MYSVLLGVPGKPVATQEQLDDCEFFKRQDDKRVEAIISSQGINEDTLGS